MYVYVVGTVISESGNQARQVGVRVEVQFGESLVRIWTMPQGWGQPQV